MNTKLTLLAGAITMASVSAHAVGLITGPASTTAKGSFPTYYQDANGLALEHCLPDPGAELNSAACLIGAADAPKPLLPITFPSNFPGETFFFAADSAVPFANGEDAMLVMALEATFAAEEPVPGDQILFARIRFRFVAPVTGTYTVKYPYGEKTVEAIAGERVFDTDDTGIMCGMDFSCAATDGQIGPHFLRPSTISGGEPLDFYTANGKTYIAEPGVETPVTGGSFGNIFRIEGPVGSDLGGPGVDFVETDLFTLVGRVNTNPLPSNITLEKATFSRSYDENRTQIDVNVKAVKGLGQPDPQLKLFGKDMPGVTMARDSDKSAYYHGRLILSGNRVPDAVYVADLLEQSGRVIPVTLADQVKIKSSEYDVDTRKLYIRAESSDRSNSHHGSHVLTVFGSDGKRLGVLNSDGELDITLSPGNVPPAKVLVVSNRHGKDEAQVRTSNSIEVEPDVSNLNAVNDSDVNEAAPIDVLGNDLLGMSPVKVRIVTAPGFGSVTVNGDNTVSFVQSAPVLGDTNDSFSYYLTDADGNISNVATVSFVLSAANLPPVALADTASVSANSSVTIDVLANDSDPEGKALEIVSVSSANATIVDNKTKIVFTAPAGSGGTQLPFTYTVRDADGVESTGNVSVSVTQPVTVAITLAELRQSKNQWRVSGTVNPAFVGMTVKVYVDSNNNNAIDASDRLVGETLELDAADAAAGVWDFRSTTAAATNGSRILAVSSLGGNVGRLNLTVRR